MIFNCFFVCVSSLINTPPQFLFKLLFVLIRHNKEKGIGMEKQIIHILYIHIQIQINLEIYGILLKKLKLSLTFYLFFDPMPISA